MHANFSTNKMREEGGMKYIVEACEALGTEAALSGVRSVYGEGLERRLTGNHETCSIDEYKFGVSDRAASVRIPWHVDKQGRGYIEDRRPNSNADPYRVLTYLLDTVGGK